MEKAVEIVDLMVERLQDLINFMINSAREGNKKYQLNISEGHHLKYANDIEYIKFQRFKIEEGLK